MQKVKITIVGTNGKKIRKDFVPSIVFKCIIIEGISANDHILFVAKKEYDFFSIKFDGSALYDEYIKEKLKKEFKHDFLVSIPVCTQKKQKYLEIYFLVVPKMKIINNTRTFNVKNGYKWVKMDSVDISKLRGNNKRAFLSLKDDIDRLKNA